MHLPTILFDPLRDRQVRGETRLHSGGRSDDGIIVWTYGPLELPP
jgi:hypothetical protein